VLFELGVFKKFLAPVKAHTRRHDRSRRERTAG